MNQHKEMKDLLEDLRIPAPATACFLATTGRTGQAIELAQKTIERHPLSDNPEATYSFALYLGRRCLDAGPHGRLRWDSF